MITVGFTKIQLARRFYSRTYLFMDSMKDHITKTPPTIIPKALEFELIDSEQRGQLTGFPRIKGSMFGHPRMLSNDSEEDANYISYGYDMDLNACRNHLYGKMYKDHPDYYHPVAREPFRLAEKNVTQNLLNTGRFCLLVKNNA